MGDVYFMPYKFNECIGFKNTPLQALLQFSNQGFKSWRCRTQPHTHPLSVRPCYTYTTLEVAVNSCETSPTALNFTCSCMPVNNCENYEVAGNNVASLERSNKMLLTLRFH